MSAATLTIGAKERGTLHWLMARRLFILGHRDRAGGSGIETLPSHVSHWLHIDLPERVSSLGYSVKTVTATH